MQFRIGKASKNTGRVFDDLAARCFHDYGGMVARYPSYFLISSLLFTAICATGFHSFKVDLDLYKLFVPLNAPVRVEHMRRIDFQKMPLGILKTDGQSRAFKRAATDGMFFDILRFYAVDKNYKNLLKPDILKMLYGFTLELMNVSMEYNGKIYKFDEFCEKGVTDECKNDLNVWLRHAEILFSGTRTRKNPNLLLSYPVMYLFNRPKDIGNVVYGVNVSDGKHEITAARVLTLHWKVAFVKNGIREKAMWKFRDKIEEFWANKSVESGIRIISHNEKAMEDELRLIIHSALPFAIPISIQLMLFVILSNYSRDKTRSKPVEAYLAVISVILSLISTFGIMFHTGFSFNPVISTMPFLILAIGVDDAFLILGAWRTSNRRWSVEKRMAVTMSNAGASISATSLTNFSCFALGYFLCTTPAVSDFCIITAFGILLDFAYQITFYAAIIVYSGRIESTGGLLSYFYKKDEALASPQVEINEEPMMHKFFGDFYSDFILRTDVKVLSWIAFCIYAVLAMYGCITLTVDISPRKYVRDNSPLQTFLTLADKYIWADNVMPIFHVMKPPDLRIEKERTRINEVIYRLEHTNYSIGRVATNFWLWEYQKYLNDFSDVIYTTDFYNQTRLSDFFSQMDYQQYRPEVKILPNAEDRSPCIAAFTFQTGFYGLNSWEKRQSQLYYWREIMMDYPEFDMFIAGIFSPYLIDQRKSIAPSSMQSTGSAIIMMALISIFFIPNLQSSMIMSWSLLSISMGVCGGLSLWGSDLDTVSVGCIIMAIGLAVDFSVHICYHYHRSTKIVPEDKVKASLVAIGWPVLQAGGSTLFAMISLPLIPAYLVRVFFQTVVLVNVIGLTHALLWIPQLISALDPYHRVRLREKHMLSQDITNVSL